MSDEGEITKRDLAMVIKEFKQEEATAKKQMAANLYGSVWDTLGTEATDPDISEAEAEEILSNYPYDGDIATGEWQSEAGSSEN